MNRKATLFLTLICLTIGLAVPITRAREAQTTVSPTISSQNKSGPSAHISGELLALVAEAAATTEGTAVTSANDLLLLDETGTAVNVQITARDVAALLPSLQTRGFHVAGSQPELHFVEGFIPIDQIPGLTALVGQGLLGVAAVPRPATGAGSVTSQGDFIHEADRVRATTPGYDGSGVRVGILSDSFDLLGGAAAGVASGDLPAAGVNVLIEGPGGSIDEGRGMAELVHDLAPGADIAFASAFYGQAAFGNAIRALADPANGNCQIITDDIFYFDEPMFQDGVIAQAIDEVVTTRNVAYFALAGNLETQSYESASFSPATDPSLAGAFHDFDPGAGVDTRQRITIPAGARIIITLQWDDPFYTVSGVDSDVDIFLLNAGADTVVASSDGNNLATQIPNERFSYTNASGSAQSYDMVIQLFSGPTPGRIKVVNYGRNNNPAMIFDEYATNSATVIPHGAAVNGRGVGAVHFYDQANPTNFTSAGPNTILFQPDGAPQTAELRQTPDFAAIQGTDTTFFGSDFDGNGFPNFFGTSAAAPHAAAIAALVRQAHPAFTPTQIYDALAASAIDISAPGFDNRTGLGLLNAYDAIFGPAAPSPLLFSDDLESGALSLAWETNSNGAGRILTTSANGPAGGTFHVTMDSALNNIASLNELVLHVDAAGRSGVTLTFDQIDFGDEDQPMPATFAGSGNYDGVALSVDGINWFRLVSLTGTNSTGVYQSFNIDLSQAASDNGLVLGADTRIKFQQYDDFPIGTDGFAFDNFAVTAANSAPVLDTSQSPALPPIDENVAAANNPGGLVADLIAGIVTDADAGALQGVAVTAVAADNGAWQYSTDGGSSWIDFGAPMSATARLLDTAARIRFLPNPDFNGLVDPGVTFRAWDQTSGSSGDTADTSIHGGSSAFSSAIETASISVTPVDDPFYQFLPLIMK